MNNTTLLVNKPLNELNIQHTKVDVLVINQSVHCPPQEKIADILFVTSFPPRECGIATYSHDLINALTNQFSNSFSCSVCALESDSEKHVYKQQPKYILNTDNYHSFIKTATAINKDATIQLVVMQHEFGFFAKNEYWFKNFFKAIAKPIVFVFHTVLPSPDYDLKSSVQDMAFIASAVVVMTLHAQDILINQYQIPGYKIFVIPHGTHLVAPIEKVYLKNKYGFVNRKILITFGLLSSSKNIETTLTALHTVINKHPDILFLVVGKTHPSVFKNEGEKYRNMLENMVRELKLENYVKFINAYLPLPTLLEYLQLSDIYLFTSKDPYQAVSGTFSYAVSCGCSVISTPIPHAKEVLRNNNGVIIGFENPPQLSNAITALLENENARIEISSNNLHKMASTAWQNSAIAHAELFNTLTDNAFTLVFKIPSINISHIKKMTTEFGMIQFSKMSIPDIFSGYTLDDNARALIALSKKYYNIQNKNELKLINTYLQFVKFCLQPNGYFLNYVSKHKGFTHQNKDVNLEDSTGRAIWALGYVSSLKNCLPINITNEADNLLLIVKPHLNKIHSTRAMCFIIKGLCFQNKNENHHLIKIFADRLVQMYNHERKVDWQWFETYLTYGNSLLPEALLCAYQTVNDINYKIIAVESFHFLLSKIFIKGKIKVISNNGWLFKDQLQQNTIGGEQPIDVAYTILALERFYEVFKKDLYKQKALIAFNWFLGDNHLNQIVYNPCTGGCYDGVEELNVNLNQGAESTLSYLLARLSIEEILNN